MMQIPKEYTWEFEGHLFASLFYSKKPQTQLVKWMAQSSLPVKRNSKHDLPSATFFTSPHTPTSPGSSVPLHVSFPLRLAQLF